MPVCGQRQARGSEYIALTFLHAAMPSVQRVFLIALFAVPTAAAAAVLALPGQTACAFVGLTGRHAFADGSLTESASEADRQRYLQLASDARARIEATFGAVESDPIIVFFNGSDGFGPFQLNRYGSAQMVGSHSCVMMGPKGQNVDVVAHELMHAELHSRVGYRRYLFEVPTWFDEGVAMQVDQRPRYALSPKQSQTADYVRALTTNSLFTDADEERLVQNYASAKEVVARWTANAGKANLYSRLDRLKKGEPFPEVFPDWELSPRASGLPSVADEPKR